MRKVHSRQGTAIAPRLAQHFTVFTYDRRGRGESCYPRVYSIPCNDVKMDRCIRSFKMAAKIPPACVGSIEVRPVRPIRETVRAGSQPWADKP